jgi:hypothetical protein
MIKRDRPCFWVWLGLFFAAGLAGAASPVGQWRVTFYSEPDLAPGSAQILCFKADGTWYATTVNGWDGEWFQKGDRFRWYGHSDNKIATAFFGQFVANSSSTGEFASFDMTAPTATSNRGNWTLRKLRGRCDPEPPLRSLAKMTSDPTRP